MQLNEPIDVNSQEELEALLMQMWPDGEVAKAELFSTMGITMPLEKNIITSRLGVRAEMFRVSDIAALFWEKSNYGQDDDF